nr:acyloxyacyl hydrolase [uncultured Carboxylicivirga sp.]
MKKLLFINFYLIFIWLNTNAQSTYSDTTTEKNIHKYITARYMHGLVIPHHKTMLYFIDDFANGIELNYGFRNFNSGSWQSSFNYPEIGIGLYYGTFGNKNVYGTGYALFPYIQHSIVRTRKLNINNKVSMGLGYATKPYDIEDNSYNMIFSTHFNIYIGLGLNVDYRISDRFSTSLSGDLTHMSNGAAKKPNHGVNVISLGIGGKYHFNKDLNPTIKKTPPNHLKERELLIVGSIGKSQSSIYNPNKFWNTSLNINYIWHINEKKGIGIGIDQIYSESIPYAWEEVEQTDKLKTFTNKDYFITGIFASYNVYLGKTNIFTNLGVYIKHNVKPPQPVYPRLGVRYPILPNLIGNFSVKASFFRSEFIEFGLGYRFKYSKFN